MTTLENILQDIENGVYGTKGVEKVHMIMRGDEGYVPIHWCLDIIKKHLACEKNAETERQSQDNDEWIPCSYRLPDKGEKVLCYFKYEPESPDVMCDNVYIGSGMWQSEMLFSKLKDVTSGRLFYDDFDSL